MGKTKSLRQNSRRILNIVSAENMLRSRHLLSAEAILNFYNAIKYTRGIILFAKKHIPDFNFSDINESLWDMGKIVYDIYEEIRTRDILPMAYPDTIDFSFETGCEYFPIYPVSFDYEIIWNCPEECPSVVFVIVYMFNWENIMDRKECMKYFPDGLVVQEKICDYQTVINNLENLRLPEPYNNLPFLIKYLAADTGCFLLDVSLEAFNDGYYIEQMTIENIDWLVYQWAEYKDRFYKMQEFLSWVSEDVFRLQKLVCYIEEANHHD